MICRRPSTDRREPNGVGPAQVIDLDGVAIGPRLVAARHDVAPSNYYVWHAAIGEPGFYALVVDGGSREGSVFEVVWPDDATVPLVGTAFEGFDTPTLADPAGVDPVCTRDPMCPFHAVTWNEALADPRGVVYLVGTPAFCQTGTCTPGLEALIEVADEFTDDYVFVHAEVYTDLTATELAPAVEFLGLQFEPVIFVIDGDGRLVDRLDSIWNSTELRATLSSARTS